MNNGVTNSNQETNTSTTNNTEQRETIQAAKVYRLSPEQKQEEKKEEPKEVVEEVKETPVVEPVQAPKKKKNIIARLFFLIILGMGGYIAFQTYQYKLYRNYMVKTCTPVSTMKEEKELDINSNIVQDLYGKVKTTIREDLVESELNKEMKLYLAYRQIPQGSLFKSTCTGFDPSQMIPYTCDDIDFEPFVFKKEDLKIEYEKLFGEDPNFEYGNIQIGKSCIGGFEYIESRGEYVQGTCKESTTTTYRVKKELIKATSKQSTIYLRESVRYSSSEGQSLPSHLRNGNYVYVFKLDKNYNYNFVNKYLEEE